MQEQYCCIIKIYKILTFSNKLKTIHNSIFYIENAKTFKNLSRKYLDKYLFLVDFHVYCARNICYFGMKIY